MATKKKAARPEVVDEPTRYEFETFRDFDMYEQSSLTAREPSCFNGRITIRKWRIVAEVVDEPVEVLASRLRKLWRECDNHHHRAPLRDVAASLGVTLEADEFGADRNRKRN